MFSLLAMVVTALVLVSALLWRAVMNLRRARPAALGRALWRRGAILMARNFGIQASPKPPDRRADAR